MKATLAWSIFACLAAACAVPSHAVASPSVCLYADPGDRTTCLPDLFFDEFDLYLVACDLDGHGIDSWECAVVPSNQVLMSLDRLAGDAVNTGEGFEYRVRCSKPLMPDARGEVVLAVFKVIAFDVGGIVLTGPRTTAGAHEFNPALRFSGRADRVECRAERRYDGICSFYVGREMCRGRVRKGKIVPAGSGGAVIGYGMDLEPPWVFEGVGADVVRLNGQVIEDMSAPKMSWHMVQEKLWSLRQHLVMSAYFACYAAPTRESGLQAFAAVLEAGDDSGRRVSIKGNTVLLESGRPGDACHYWITDKWDEYDRSHQPRRSPGDLPYVEDLIKNFRSLCRGQGLLIFGHGYKIWCPGSKAEEMLANIARVREFLASGASSREEVMASVPEASKLTIQVLDDLIAARDRSRDRSKCALAPSAPLR